MRVVQREREKEKGKKVSTSKSHLAKAKAKADCGPALSRSVHCSRRLKVKCRQRKGGGKKRRKEGKPSFGVVRIPPRCPQDDRWITRVHFLASSIVVSTPFIGAPAGPHTVIPTERSTFENDAYTYLGIRSGAKRVKANGARDLSLLLLLPFLRRTTRTDLMIATPFHVPRLFHRISNQPFRAVFRTVPAASPLPITPLPPNDFPPRWIPFPLSIGRETGNEEGRHIIWQALTRARERRIEDPNSLIHDRVGPRKPIKPGKYLVWRREEDGSEEEEEEGALAGP